MPKVFNEENRKLIRDHLIKYGMDALEVKGYKNVSVESIARQAGIAKGTFYNFFTSKEDFFYNILLFIRDRNRVKLNHFFARSQNKESISDFLYEKYSCNKTIYRYFTTDEVRILFRKMPEKLAITDADSIDFADAIFSGMKAGQNTRLTDASQSGRAADETVNINSEPDSEVVVNMMSIMGAFAADHMPASEGKENKTLRLLADSLASYIVEGKKDESF